MAGPDHIPFVDTSVAMSQLLNGQARVRPGPRLSESEQVVLSDSLSPHELTPDLLRAIELELDAYRKHRLIQQLSSAYRGLKRPHFVKRIAMARALRELADQHDHDRADYR